MTQQRRSSFDWSTPPLSAEDDRLVNAYITVGRSLDDLPYTEAFERLCTLAGLDDSLQARHRAFKRLFSLRMSRRLPGWDRLSSGFSLGLNSSEWSMPPLSAEDERLVDAYITVGRPLNDLPYTEDFDRLSTLAGLDDSHQARHMAYRRLLRLDKSGRLPRVDLRRMTSESD